MALIALSSAKGSPGVTTTAIALAAVHPRSVVVAELDPAGGDLAWRCTDPEQQPLDHERGLLSLGAAVRHGPVDLRPHLQTVHGGLDVLLGITGPEQVGGLGPVWPAIAATLAQDPAQDVFADCGRYAPGTPALPVLQAADLVVMVVRHRLADLAHLRERLGGLSEATRSGRRLGPIAVVVVAPERERTSSTDVQRLLDAAGLDAQVLGVIADDPRAADWLTNGRSATVGRTTLVRSARAVSQSLLRRLAPVLVG